MPSTNDRCIAHLDIKGQEPLNAEPDVLSLVQFTHTPDELVYCRNHCTFVYVANIFVWMLKDTLSLYRGFRC